MTGVSLSPLYLSDNELVSRNACTTEKIYKHILNIFICRSMTYENSRKQLRNVSAVSSILQTPFIIGWKPTIEAAFGRSASL